MFYDGAGEGHMGFLGQWSDLNSALFAEERAKELLMLKMLLTPHPPLCHIISSVEAGSLVCCFSTHVTGIVDNGTEAFVPAGAPCFLRFSARPFIDRSYCSRAIG